MSLIISTSAICIIILGLMHILRKGRRRVNPLNGQHVDYSPFLVFAFGFVLTFVASFRAGFQDTEVYRGLCANMGTDYDYAFTPDLPITDVGFNLLMIFLNRMNAEPQMLIIVTSCLSIPAFIYAIGRYSEYPLLSLLLFLCTSYISTMNGIRQILVSGLLVLGLPWLRDKKTIPYLLLILLLSTFHGSALVLIPLYFVISGKRMNPGLWIFMILVVACFIAPGRANALMGDLLEDTVYVEYLENQNQMGIMRFLVALVPTLLALLYCWVQKDNRDGEDVHSPRYLRQRTTDILINMQLVTFGFTALGMHMVYFARISMYFNTVLPMLLPTVIEGCFDRESVKMTKIIAALMYVFYYSYQIYTYHVMGGWYGFELAL